MNRRVIFGGGSLLIVALVVLVAALSSGKPSSSATSGAGKPAATADDNGPILPCKDLPPARAIEPLVKPGPDVPANLARFSGAWEGMAGSDYAALVVVNVDAKQATSFYAYGSLRGRLVSEFQPDGSLHHGGNQQITFTWSFGQSPNILQSVHTEGNSAVAYTMRKCTLLP